MMAAILNSAMLDSATAMLDSDTLLSTVRFTEKLSHSTLTLTQTDSIWLKLIHSHLTLWWQPCWILPSWIQPFWTKKNFTHSFWLNLKMSAILNFCHHEFCHLGFSHLLSLIPLKLIFMTGGRNWIPTILESAILKKTSLIHSDSSWWWQQSWILPCWIQTLPSWNQTPCYLLSDSLKNTLTPLRLWLKLIQSDSNSFFLTQLDDGSHLEILPCWIQTTLNKKNHFCHSFWLNLKMAAILKSTNSETLPICSKKLHSFNLINLVDGSHLELCNIGFSHFAFKTYEQ